MHGYTSKSGATVPLPISPGFSDHKFLRSAAPAGIAGPWRVSRRLWFSASMADIRSCGSLRQAGAALRATLKRPTGVWFLARRDGPRER
jgi:hypothetical protein